jgi:DtxR family Mn-dependent transcriptional regulator
MPSKTVENYLKRILLLENKEQAVVSMGSLAEAMKVTPGTVTTMAKSLAADGWLEHHPREGVQLTEGGRALALSVVRRHRLIESFLVRHLNMDWAEVHVEAEELEHAVSDNLLARIDATLGHPETDPHGDPIPSLKGALKKSAGTSLASCEVNASVKVLRVHDQTPAFLGLAERTGLKPGARVTVISRDLVAGVVEIGLRDGSRQTLGLTEAGKIEIEAADRRGDEI